MSPQSRRRLLGTLAAVASVGIGAGCLRSDFSELRVRNFSRTIRPLRVEVATDTGKTLLGDDFELDPDEQHTVDDIYDSAGTYVVIATVSGATATGLSPRR